MTLGIGLSLLPWNVPGSVAVFTTFGLLAAVHIYSSYRALSSVAFSTLNIQRTSLILDCYFTELRVPSPNHIKAIEKIITKPDFDQQPPRIIFGVPLSKAVYPLEQLSWLLSLFGKEKYMVNIQEDKIVVVFHEEAQSTDMLKSYFTAYYIRSKILHTLSPRSESADLIKLALQNTKQNFDTFHQQLEQNNWNTKHLLLLPHNHRANWDIR